MLFPTHIIIAIPLVIFFDLSLIPVVLGCMIPDLIDKQLPKIGVTENYHTVSHSSITIIFLSIISIVYTFLIPLIVGWVFHIFLDIIHIIINKRYSHIWFITWPVKFDPDPLNIPPFEFFKYYIGSKSYYLEIIIWFICIYLFLFNYENLI